MDDRISQTGRAGSLEMAVTAYTEACAAARAWEAGPAEALPAILGSEHFAEIEALRDAAIHQAAVEPWAAATARMLLERCIEIVERGSRGVETAEWEENEAGMPYVAYIHRDVFLDTTAQAANCAAAALRTLARAIEHSLDLDAAIERYCGRDC